MSSWSNIEVLPDDPEIIQINSFEKTCQPIPPNVEKIRELITRFEVCHFKYEVHIRIIRDSILNLKPSVDPKIIGTNHIRHGEKSWKKDTTDRSLSGQRYVWALKRWIGDKPSLKGMDNKILDQQIFSWLGKKSNDKESLVLLLLARLTWDWKSYEELVGRKENKELEFQVCRVDICHYNFPKILDLLIQGIGELKPLKSFQGCGSFNSEIRIIIELEFSRLNELLNSMLPALQTETNAMFKAWLISCLMKTMKEQVGLTQAIVV